MGRSNPPSGEQRDGIYRDVVDNLLEFVVRWTPDGTRTFVNRSYAEYYGRTPEEMIGTSFFPLIAQEADREKVRRKIAALTPEHPFATDEHQVVLPGGGVGWNSWTDYGLFDEVGRLVELQSVGRDTTRLHQTQRALERSEKKFRQAFQSSPDSLTVTRVRDDHLIDVNQGFERLFAIPRADAIGRTSIELGVWKNPGDRARLKEMLVQGGSVHAFEGGFVARDGRQGIAQVSIGGVFELDGEECFLTVVRDVTEARAAERAIRRSEQRYRRLFESAYDAVMVVQGDVLMDCNEQALVMFDLPREALVGTTPWVHSPPKQPDGGDSRILGREYIERTLAGEKMMFEWVHLRRDGTEFPVEISLSPLTLDGDDESAFLAVLRDISQRKQAENDLRTAYDEIRQLRDQLQAENIYLREELEDAADFGDIIGDSEPMRGLREKIELVAPTDSTALLLGESGTGKELIAREIHRLSERSRRAMIRVNCASIPNELYESEFFGHVKGAFTGAVKDRVGRFELAHCGTIFLDEIAEIPLSMQAKLLRVLQEGEYERVGDERTRTTDVRVIAATNQDLEQEVREGRFRADLFYRLNVFPIDVPSLRERGEDILVLARHFLVMHATVLKRPVPRLTRSAAQQLLDYEWPGNVRELQNVIERAVILSRGGPLRLDLPAADELSQEDVTEDSGHGFLTENQMKAFEKRNLRAVLERTNWQVFGPDGAAALLGVRPTTLTSRLKRLGLRRPSAEN